MRDMQTTGEKIILQPELIVRPTENPNEYQRRDSGVLTLPDYQADQHLATPNETRVLTLEPKKYQVLRLGGNENSPDLTPQQEQNHELNEKLIFYLSNPWDYFASLFETEELSSPIDEINDQIKTAKNKLPQLSSSSKILLRSPFKKIRETEQQRLFNSGIKEKELADCLLPDTAFIKASELNFIEENKDSALLDAFYQILIKSLNDLMIINTNPREQIKHFSKFFEYLIILSESFMYQSGNFKMDNPIVLEKIAQKLEFILNLDPSTIEKRHLQTLFDFLSHFEMNNKTASVMFLDVLKKTSFQHPLIHELKYQFEPEKESEFKDEKIGIEIEAIPLIAFDKLPTGFELGLDGGGVMPEFRRKIDALYFTNQYKKQLFELWYWTKILQLKGASLHIHIDDLDQKKLVIFESIFGDNQFSVKKNQKQNQTVELRFNLSGYTSHKNKKERIYLDLSKAFFHEQYDIVPLIEVLLKIANKHDQEEIDEAISKLPNFWKIRFKQKENQLQEKKINFQELIKICENSGWDVPTTIESLNALEKRLSFNEFLTICQKSHWHHYLTQVFLEYLEKKFGLDEAIVFIDKKSQDFPILEIALEKLEKTLTPDQLLGICEKINYSYTLSQIIFSKLEKKLSLNEVMTIFRKTKLEKEMMLAMALEKLDGKLNLHQIVSICKQVHWDTTIVNIAFDQLDRQLSLDEAKTIFSLAGEEYSENTILKRTISISSFEAVSQKIKGKLSLKEVIDICNLTNWRRSTVEMAFSKLERNLNKKEVLNICKQIDWSYYLAETIFEKLDKGLSLKEILKIFKQSKNDKGMLKIALEKFDGELNLNELLKIIKMTNQSCLVFPVAFNKFKGVLSLDQAIKICRLINWDYYLIKTVLNRLQNELSYKEAMRLFETSGQSFFALQTALRKLSEKLSLNQFVEMCQKTNWHSNIIKIALEKLETPLSLEIIKFICEKGLMDGDILKLVIKKIDLEEYKEKTDFQDDFIELLQKVSPNLQLFAWTSLTEIGLKKPVSLAEVFS